MTGRENVLAADASLPTSDPEPRALDTSVGRLAFVEEGPRDGPALLTVHGIPGSIRDFRYLAPQLARSVRVVRVDLPGFGASTESAPASSLEGRKRALVALADHLELGRFAVLGHSMGGATALITAAEERARVTALVLVASVGLRPHRGLGLSPRAFRVLGLGFGVPLLRRWLVRGARARYKRRGFPGADQLDARGFAFQFKAIGAADFGRLRAAAAGALPPTLIAFAEDDPMVESSIQHELVAARPEARRLAFASGGHNIQKTRAAELAEAIVEMLVAR